MRNLLFLATRKAGTLLLTLGFLLTDLSRRVRPEPKSTYIYTGFLASEDGPPVDDIDALPF